MSGKKKMRLAVFVASVVTALAAAAAFAGPPPGATAQCRDGTYSYSQHRSGTCSFHGGVAVWPSGSASRSRTSGADTRASSSGSCGVERWTVKTLQDRPTLLPAKTTTVRYLVSRPAPHPLPTTRLPFERHVYIVTAAVTLVRQEADSDLHLVLHADGQQMIAESPAPSCDSKAAPLRRQQMSAARAHVRLCARARVIGVAFFDFDHGQTGVAPNAIELHPVLGFRCLSG
ncbi:MAG TPA: DUF3761 domain-containing protein [Gaiellaceae bacterium]|nr:DUF3761 domain-containing protein [Gaiellaceae bacterium]